MRHYNTGFHVDARITVTDAFKYLLQQAAKQTGIE